MTGRLALFQADDGRFLDYFKVEEPRDYRHNSLLTFSSDGAYVIERSWRRWPTLQRLGRKDESQSSFDPQS
jgi:hypothetical protein